MGCCCSNADAKTVGAAEKYKTQKGFLILGGGCKNCHALMQNTIDALAEMNREENVELVTDFSVIATFGIMSTPALVHDGKVVSYGKVLTKEQIKKFI